MAWLWSSWQEYLDYVSPVAAKRRSRFNSAVRHSWFETECKLGDAVRRLSAAMKSLGELGFTGKDDNIPPHDTSILQEVRHLVIELVYAGEELLLYHSRLAKSRASYGFLSQHDILEHWDGSWNEGVFREIDQLMTDTSELLAGYHEIKEADGQFLVYGLDLPSDLESDFRLARNLFSVGFDDIGVLLAGRGLEGVLRKIAQVRKIVIEIKGRAEPASDADLVDLIEAMYRLRWKAAGLRFITTETRALLHYLRALRNGHAHPAIQGKRSSTAPREMATVAAEIAERLWKDVSSTRARFVETTIRKTW